MFKKYLLIQILIAIFIKFEAQSANFDLEIDFEIINTYFDCRNVNSIILFNKNFNSSSSQRNLNIYSTKFVKRSILFQFSYENLLYTINRNKKRRIGIIIYLEVSDLSEVLDFMFEVIKISSFQENVVLLIVIVGQMPVYDYISLAPLSLSSDVVFAIDKNFLDPELNITNCTEIINNYCFLQVYKIRTEDRSSLILHSIEVWNYENATNECFTNFLQIEQRKNLQSFTLKLGKKNSTNNDMPENSIEDDSDEEKLVEIANYFKMFLNASIDIVYFQKLGLKENNGEWTGLLKDVITKEVDVGLDRVISTPDRYNDMIFSHKILKSMRSIYIKPQKSTQVRDIFSIPFNNKLIFCVIATGFICSICMTLINKINKENQSFGDATIWCIGIFSMQGNISRPNTYSGNFLLIILLIFALIIYNSYSAFITSILSVKIINIRSVDDLLASNYNIGYAKNSQDEYYLRTTNDTKLQQIYLRGYLKNNLFSVTEGLLKVAKGNYGFFASVNSARRVLQIINNYRCKYDIMEIPILVTKNSIAFPMAKKSPYKKIINLSIMRMYETGIHKYIETSLIPNLPECEKKTDFQSAHLGDLVSAFAILLIGIFLSFLFLILEILWKRRQKFCKKMSIKYRK